MNPEINFKITADSQAVEYDDVIALAHALIDNDFVCYFNMGTRPFTCSAVHEKAEVMYDLMHDIAYYTDDERYVLLRSNIGGYGTYAIENLIRQEEWEEGVESEDY